MDDRAEPSADQDPDLEYVSSEDEDFNPTKVDEQHEDLSSSEEDEDDGSQVAAKAHKPPKKRKQADLEDLDSGDEATIRQSKRHKKKRAGEGDDSGGEGSLIKTRAQRRAEKEERQEYRKANTEGVTVDVDALWATLSSAPIGRHSLVPPKAPDIITTTTTDAVIDRTGKTETPKVDEDLDDMVTIKRTYDFAGQTVTEEKRVHKTSAEARLFLASNNPSKQVKPDAPLAENNTSFYRPLKRPSMFEPNPTGEVKGLPAHRQRLRTPSRADVISLQRRLDEEVAEMKAKAHKLNTVQKSAIDWAAHVDQEGYQEELDEYGRSKQGYMAKMDFLKEVEGKRDDEDRRARLMQ